MVAGSLYAEPVKNGVAILSGGIVLGTDQEFRTYLGRYVAPDGTCLERQEVIRAKVSSNACSRYRINDCASLPSKFRREGGYCAR